MVVNRRFKYWLIPIPLALLLVGVFIYQISAAGGNSSRFAESATGNSKTNMPSLAPISPSRSLNPYTEQVPRFDRPPKPEKVTLPAADGIAPITSTIPTQHPVVFITVDDGQVCTPEFQQVIAAAKVPISQFLISSVVSKNPECFRAIQRLGAPIQAHSVTHISLRGKPYEQQKGEICGSADQLADMFGKRPTLFRPPFGNYDQVTLRAIADCGMKAALYWRESVTRGHVYYQTPEKKLHPGDIILMHFRQEFVGDFIATLKEIKAAGLTPALLEDYLS